MRWELYAGEIRFIKTLLGFAGVCLLVVLYLLYRFAVEEDVFKQQTEDEQR